MNRLGCATVATWLAAVAVVSLPASSSPAQPPSDKTRAEARERFDRGLQLFNDGDNAGALAEFRRAHELVPNKVVMFNIAMVYAAMNRSVEAVDALDQLLADPGALDADRLARAKRAREEQGRRVARLLVATNVPAMIQVDGIDVARSPLKDPLRVTSGTHIVTALAQGHLPVRKEVTVAGDTDADLKLELVPSESQVGHLTIKTSVPAVELVLDGQPVGRSPLPASLTVPPGRHVVEARRRGYDGGRQEITLGDGASGELKFELVEISSGSAEDFGRLVLQVSETEAQVSVDGRPRGVYRDSLRLPVGPHALRVDRAGFQPLHRLVEIAPDVETSTRVTLAPTPETRLGHVERVLARRRWGWTTLLAGAAVGGVSGTLSVLAQRDLDGAQKRLGTATTSFDPGMVCDPKGGGNHDQCDADLAAANRSVSDQKLRRTLDVAGLAVGVAATAIGAYLLLTGEDPKKYDAPAGDLALVPLGWAGDRQQGAGVGIAGRF